LHVWPLCATVQPQLLLLDRAMPGMDGLQVMQQLQPLIPAGTYLPILLLTSDTTPQARRQALLRGAAGFLPKPIIAAEVVQRVRDLLAVNFLHYQAQYTLQREAARARAEGRSETRLDTLQRLTQAADHHDANGQHPK